MVTILGPDGRPVDRALLGQEIATPTVIGVRATHHEAIASGLTPERLAQVLRQATLGHARDYLTLAEDMEERYLHYASQVQTRRLAIEGVEPSIDAPKGVPARIVDAVHDLLDDAHLADAIGSLTDGIAKGYSVVEPIWEYERKILRPVSYKWRDPRFFQFERVGMTELRLASDTHLDGEPLLKPTFIVHMPRAKNGIPIRRGFARAAAWAFMLQSFTLKDWAAFCEIYGVPLRLGKYAGGASAEDKKTLLRAVRSIASDAAAIIPSGMEIEFIEVKGAKGETVFSGLLDYLDAQISKLVVGQTMTADEGSSMAQAKVHNEVRLDIKRADCRQLATTLNRDLIPWYVAFNFGPQDAYPKLTLPVAEPEDVKELTDGVARLVPFGFRVSQRQLRSKLGLSEPEDGEELLKAASTPVEQAQPGRVSRLSIHPGGCRCKDCAPNGFAALAAEDRLAEDDLDELERQELGDWQEIADPLLAPLRQALAGASSFAELEAMLPELAGKIDGSKLAARLARLTAIARGLGDVKD